jgi:carboxyl-terminal processing protease
MLRICSLALICLSTLPALAQDAPPATVDLMKQAEAAYQAKHFSESASLYSRALPLVQDNDRAGVEYNLACSQALAGDRAAAFETLDHAVEDGYTDRKDTEADKDLVSLHTDPRWLPLLERMTIFNAQQDARWGDGRVRYSKRNQYR